jgi:hypothetical protein
MFSSSRLWDWVLIATKFEPWTFEAYPSSSYLAAGLPAVFVVLALYLEYIYGINLLVVKTGTAMLQSRFITKVTLAVVTSGRFQATLYQLLWMPELFGMGS